MASVFHAFPALVRRLGVRTEHLAHVGAHEAQELPYYREAGFRRITLVEPIPHLAAQLRANHPDVTVAECACSEQPGRTELHVMARTNMSTLSTPGPRDKVTSVVEVEVRRLADVAPDANVAVVDAQGLELAVLRGANLPTLDLVIVETCTVADPTMASPYDEVVAFMSDAGFTEVERWIRDFDWVANWARGRGQPRTGGEIRDVAFIREAPQ